MNPRNFFAELKRRNVYKIAARAGTNRALRSEVISHHSERRPHHGESVLWRTWLRGLADPEAEPTYALS
jgi:hypothetical protein